MKFISKYQLTICALTNYNFRLHYKISRKKSEPEPGFEPRTSGSGSNFSLEILYCKFPKAQIMSLFSINNLSLDFSRKIRTCPGSNCSLEYLKSSSVCISVLKH